MVQPAGLYLTRFDVEKAVECSLDLVGNPDQSPIWIPEQEDDPETRLAASREAGYAEGMEAARAEAAAEREQAQRIFDEQFATERQKWIVEQSDILAEKLAAAVRQMQDTLAECVGQVLRPFVIESLRKQMLVDLVESVAGIAGTHAGVTLKIAGPADLLAGLREAFAALPLTVDYETSEGADVTVVASQTMIETRLQAWIDLINAKSE
jgi:flagellar biosynthesis/type III secretory pathway protein FliH